MLESSICRLKTPKIAMVQCYHCRSAIIELACLTRLANLYQSLAIVDDRQTFYALTNPCADTLRAGLRQRLRQIGELAFQCKDQGAGPIVPQQLLLPWRVCTRRTAQDNDLRRREIFL